MNDAKLDGLTWTLIYGGLLAVCLGFAVRLRDAGLGWRIIGGGLVASGIGGFLIWVRSRRGR
ncbi:MAG: hypothetical protein KGL18_10255 [Burkholderiales bacterium]|nr:hypothetical protein [Burkholderiales bacterium]MDE1927410.1 hypothetical protein [Burkholderiales bacterium]MDE2158100.1 hypothetical protein [Burkholderiales bacterium]MDE2503342.1 hypothetical protein [Burkholderiales bacterium]